MNWFLVRILILVFLGSIAVVRRAQNEFYTGGEGDSVHSGLRFSNGNTESTKGIDDKLHIQKVINILQGNIKQWSFIESQLLEPNVNVGMPEIAIPLRHLTTTLEVLGNIFFAQNDLQSARASLERACPLKELLPATPSAEEEVYATDIGDPLLDAATLGHMLWRGPAASGLSGGSDGEGLINSSNYAAGCFALLKDVYDKLYGRQQQQQPSMAGISAGSTEGGARPVAVQLDGLPQSTASSDPTARPSPARLRPASHSGGYQSYVLPNGRPREFNLKYMLSQTQQRQQMKQRRQQQQLPAQGDVAGEVRAPRVSGAKLSMAAATAGPAYREKSASAASAASATTIVPPSASDRGAQGLPSDEPGHRRRDHALLLDSEGGAALYSVDDEAPFDADQAIQDLRAPFMHLRLELREGGSSGVADYASNSPEHSSDAAGGESDNRLPVASSASSGRRGTGLGLSSGSHHIPSPTAASTGAAGTVDGIGNAVRGFEGSALNSISGEEITLPGVSTAIIADDLEVLVRKFVQATRRERRELSRQATKYFDELDINFPNMDYGEYAANMDLGQAFLEVMHRAADEGLSFVAQELEAWRAESGPGQRSGSKTSDSKTSDGKGDSNSALAALEAQYGLKFRAAGRGRTDSVRPADRKLTRAEKNRLLVLYAFDIVHTDPSDPFDLGLGFNRAIADNDRGRKGSSASTALGGHDLAPAAAELTAEAFNEALESLRSALKGDIGGLLGGAVDDAHRRLFPFDPLTVGDGRNSQRLAEQYLRDLLLLEGGAEAYLAAKSAAGRSKGSSASAGSASGKASSSGSGKGAGKRRRQRQQAVGGDGEYSVSGEGVPASNIKVGTGSSSETDPDGADYFDDAAGTTVGILSSSTLRSSVPTLGPEGAEWTLSLFLLFMVLTGAVVYSANQEAARKRMAAGRNRLRQGVGASGPIGGGKKGGSPGWVSGSSIVDFMYAQLGVVGGAPGANAAADWDDAAQAQIAAESERTPSGPAATGQHAAPVSVGSASLFSGSLNSLMLGSRLGKASNTISVAPAPMPAAAGAGAKTAGVSGKGRKGRDGQVAGTEAPGAKATEEPPKAAVRSTLFGDLLSLVAPAGPSPSSVELSKGPHLSAPQNGKRRDSPRTGVPSSELVSKPPSNGASATVSGNASAAFNGAGAAGSAAASTSGKSKKGKNKDQKGTNGVLRENCANNASAAQPVSRQQQKPQDTMSRSQPSSDSLASSASSNGSSDSDGSKPKSATATPAPFNPPVVLNNRRVSWAGLIPTSPNEGIAAQDGSEGDWAEARKKSRNKHATSSATGEEGQGAGHASGSMQRPERIALSLKESPLYRHPPARPGPPRPAYLGSSTRAAAGPGGTALTAAAAGNSARPQQAAPRPIMSAPGSAQAGGRQLADGSIGGAHSASRNRALLDLSEAMLLAEQRTSWSGSSSSAASPHGRGPDGANASPGPGLGPSPRSTAQLPPGLPAFNSTRTVLAANTSAAATPHLSSSGAGGNTAFGFGQFDINRLGGSAGLYAGANPLPWTVAATTASAVATTDRATAIQPDSEASAQGGEYAGSELFGGLGDYASLLLSGSSVGTVTAPATASTGANTAAYAAYYGGADSAGYDTQQYETYYGGQVVDVEDEGYYYPSAEDPGQLFYGDYGDSHYGAYGLEQDQEPNGGYLGHGVAEAEEPHSVWGRSSGAAQVTSHDLTASSITSEASAVYALSPDAPSFRPSQKLPPQLSLRSHAPELAAATTSTSGTANVELGLGFADLLLSAQAGSTLTSYPQHQMQQQSPGSAQQDASDDYFQSYLIDSILGGEELSHSAEYDDD